VTLTPADPQTLFTLTGDPRFLRHLVAYEGCPFATLEGASGDLLFHFGPQALFHLEADRRRLNCAFARPDDRLSQRVLLDTVLWTTSLQVGFELLHASAVATDRGVLAFVADQGGGKTTLAAEFLRRSRRPRRRRSPGHVRRRALGPVARRCAAAHCTRGHRARPPRR
jgi:hypothetical protein